MSYAVDRAWSNQFIPQIRSIVGPLLLVESPIEVDTQEAADLIVMRARDMTIACRVRRQGYAERHPWDFTIRAKRDSGAKTEFSKIVEGWGDWMFYGHDDGRGTVDRYFVIDLHGLRAELIRDSYRPRRQLPDCSRPISNGDGTYFLAFDVRKLRASDILASSHEIPRQQAAA